MSDTTDAVVLAALRTKLRELELDHVQLAGRIMELNECIALIENPRRRGRPRKAEVIEIPAGTLSEPAPEPEMLFQDTVS